MPGSEVHVGGEVFSVNMPHLSGGRGDRRRGGALVLIVVLGSLWAAPIPLAGGAGGGGRSRSC